MSLCDVLVRNTCSLIRSIRVLVNGGDNQAALKAVTTFNPKSCFQTSIFTMYSISSYEVQRRTHVHVAQPLVQSLQVFAEVLLLARPPSPNDQ